MQRLKYVAQLGSVYHIFPGATHNRFEHSCGTGFLCHKQMRVFEKQWEATTALSQVEKPFTNTEQRRVVLAGLMHDAGHGI